MTPDSRPSRFPRTRRFIRKGWAALERFFRVEAASGIVLLIAAVAALIWANSAFSHSYEALWHLEIPLRVAGFEFTRSLHFWINDGLMTLFFLVVGMEVRREMHEGALSDAREAALPIVAALGGVVVPALAYVMLVRDPAHRHGWAVPTATDIAFAVGVLSLLGKRVPSSVRVFLLALAIIDDIVAVLIIALFYSGGLNLAGLGLIGLGVIGVVVLQRLRVGSAWVYVVPGVVVWAGFLQMGVHPTLAGVVLGLLTPVRALRGNRGVPVVKVEAALHPWVAFGVMPLFALANAGVGLSGGGSSEIVAGVACALAVGKPVGVLGACWLAVKLKLCRLPGELSWRWMGLAGLLAGIGFTMSIFISMLAFKDAGLLGSAKLGVLIGSAVAAVLGLGWGVVCARREV